MKRMMRRFFLFALICLAMRYLARPAAVFALPNFPPVVMKTYQPKTGGVVAGATAKCTHCVMFRFRNLNPYGLEIKAALKAAGTRDANAGNPPFGRRKRFRRRWGRLTRRKLRRIPFPADACQQTRRDYSAEVRREICRRGGRRTRPLGHPNVAVPETRAASRRGAFPDCADDDRACCSIFWAARTKNRSLHAAAYYNIAVAALLRAGFGR